MPVNALCVACWLYNYLIYMLVSHLAGWTGAFGQLGGQALNRIRLDQLFDFRCIWVILVIRLRVRISPLAWGRTTLNYDKDGVSTMRDASGLKVLSEIP